MLNPKGLGLSGGILWGVSLMVMTWAGVAFGYAPGFLEIMTQVYPGFNVSYMGSLIGLAYGFVDGFVGLFILAWLYNKFSF